MGNFAEPFPDRFLRPANSPLRALLSNGHFHLLRKKEGRSSSYGSRPKQPRCPKNLCHHKSLQLPCHPGNRHRLHLRRCCSNWHRHAVRKASYHLRIPPRGILPPNTPQKHRCQTKLRSWSRKKSKTRRSCLRNRKKGCHREHSRSIWSYLRRKR